MAVTSIKNKTKSGSLLVGNQYYLPTDFESIATVTVGSTSVSTIQFSSLPTTYKHLQIRISARSAAASNYGNFYLTFNNDDGSGLWSSHNLRGNGTSVGSTYHTNADIYWMTQYNGSIPGNNTTASIFGAVVIDIMDYTNTNKYKTLKSFYGFDLNGTASGTGELALTSGAYRSTSTPTSIELVTGDLFKQYSSFALYGIKG